MKKLLSILFLTTTLFAYESFINKSENIQLTKNISYSKNNYTLEQALKKCKNNNFTPLPKQAQISNFNHSWLCLELKNKSDKNLFLSLTDTSVGEVTFYKYINNKLQIVQKNSNNKIPMLNYIPKIKLETSTHAQTYLIEVQSYIPFVMNLLIGDESDIIISQLPEIITLCIFIGVFLGIFIYNIFLYISTKQNDYIFYSIFTLFLVGWVLSFHGYFSTYFQLNYEIAGYIKNFFLIGSLIFLFLFSTQFLNIKLFPSRILIPISLAFFIILLKSDTVGYNISIISELILGLLLIYLGIKKYQHKNPPSKYFLIALIGYAIGSLFTILIFNGILSTNFYTLQSQLISSTWSIIFLSLALGEKVSLFQEERNKAILTSQVQEKMLFLQSRQASIGELVGNITHQWREPLGEIGAIQTNLHATLFFKKKLTEEKILKSIEESTNIIRHLSDTIEVFYRLFNQKENESDKFNLLEELQNIEKIVHYSLEVENIRLEYKVDSNIDIYADRNEFINAILNIILNAKDILVKRKILIPFIKIEAKKSNDSGEIQIIIEDNGGGIIETPITKIFESCITSKKDGIGIGLFITKKIIEERMHGQIDVKNGKDGALFIISLPSSLNFCNLDNLILSYNTEESTLKRITRLEKEVSKQEELKKALNQWENIFNETYWGVSVHKSTNKKFEMINPAFCKMYGYSKNELENMLITKLFEKQSIELFYQKLREAFSYGFSSFETIQLKKDGTKFPVNIHITVVKDEDGDILYHIFNIHDITEQKKINEELFLKKFAINHVNEAIFLIDKNANFHYVNKGACKALGYTKEELLSMKVMDIDPNISMQIWQDHWIDIKNQKTTLLLSQHKRKDSTVFPIEVSSNYFEYNGVEYSLAISRNITERLEAQKREDDEKMRLFFERQLVGMAITSPTKGWLHVNDKLCQMLGYSEKKLKTMTWAEVTHPEDLQGDIELFEQLLKGEIEHYFYEKRYIHKNGDIVFANLSIGCVRKEDNSVDYLIVLIEDITERKKIEKALKTSEQKFRTLIENATDNIVRYDKEARVTYVNPQLEKVLGVSSESVLGKTPTQNEPDEIYIQFEIELKKVIATGENAHTYLTLPDIGNGKQYHYIQIVAERDINGNIIGAIAFGRDVTELTNKTIELQKSLEFNEGVIAAIPDLLLEVAPDGTYVGVWAQNPEILAAQKEMLLGNDFKKILPPDVVSIGLKTLKEVDEKGFSLGNSYSLELPEGKRWFELSASKKKTSGNYIVLARDITERKKMEKELADSYNFLYKLIDSIPDPIFVKDREHNWAMLNEAFCSLINQPRDVLIGKSDYDFFPKEEADIFWQKDELVFQSKEVNINEEEFTDSNDTTHYIQTVKSTFVSSDGDEYLVGTIRDITERKQMENAVRALNETLETKVEERTKELAKKEREYRTLAENMPNFLVRYDKECRRIYVNQALVDFFKISKEELLGVSLYEKLLPGVPEHFRQKVEYVFETGEKTDLEVSAIKLDKTQWWNIIFTPEFDENGQVTNVLSIGHDITKIKNAEIELKEREEKFSKLFMLSPAAVSVTSLERNMYLEVNESFLFYTKYTKEEVIGKSSLELNLFANINERTEFFEKVLNDGFVKGFEFEYQAKDGSKGWGLAYASIITLNKERCLLSHSYDINARKQLNLLNSAINTTSEAIFINDEEVSIIYVNDRACDMLGYTKDELTSMKIYDIDIQFSKREIINISKNTIEKQQVYLESKHKKKDGTIIDVSITGSSFYFNNKIAQLSIVKDITETKKIKKNT